MIVKRRCHSYITMSSHRLIKGQFHSAYMLPVERQAVLGKSMCFLLCCSLLSHLPSFPLHNCGCQRSAKQLHVMWACCTERKLVLPWGSSPWWEWGTSRNAPVHANCYPCLAILKTKFLHSWCWPLFFINIGFLNPLSTEEQNYVVCTSKSHRTLSDQVLTPSILYS